MADSSAVRVVRIDRAVQRRLHHAWWRRSRPVATLAMIVVLWVLAVVIGVSGEPGVAIGIAIVGTIVFAIPKVLTWVWTGMYVRRDLPLGAALSFELTPTGIVLERGALRSELRDDWFSAIRTAGSVVIAQPRGSRSTSPLIWPRELLTDDDLAALTARVAARSAADVAARLP